MIVGTKEVRSGPMEYYEPVSVLTAAVPRDSIRKVLEIGEDASNKLPAILKVQVRSGQGQTNSRVCFGIAI